MGSYNGLTTAVFVLNSDANARVLTLDLPPTGAEDPPVLSSDEELVARRRLVSVPNALGLSRYTYADVAARLGPNLNRRPVRHRQPDFIDLLIGDRNAPVGPVFQPVSRPHVAEAAGQSMHKHVATR